LNGRFFDWWRSPDHERAGAASLPFELLRFGQRVRDGFERQEGRYERGQNCKAGMAPGPPLARACPSGGRLVVGGRTGCFSGDRRGRSPALALLRMGQLARLCSGLDQAADRLTWDLQTWGAGNAGALAVVSALPSTGVEQPAHLERCASLLWARQAGAGPGPVPTAAVFANARRPGGWLPAAPCLAVASRWWSWPGGQPADRTRRPPCASAAPGSRGPDLRPDRSLGQDTGLCRCSRGSGAGRGPLADVPLARVAGKRA